MTFHSDLTFQIFAFKTFQGYYFKDFFHNMKNSVTAKSSIFKGPLTDLRQFRTTEKNDEKCYLFHLKISFCF